MREHTTHVVPAMAMSLTVLFLTGCLVEEVDDGLQASTPGVEVYKPRAPREARARTSDLGTVRYEVVEGEAVLEGDMRMGPVEAFEARLDEGGLQALGVGRDDGRWSMPVKYSFADSVGGDMRGHIETALARLVSQSTANISFAPCTGLCAGNHIKFKYSIGGGCAAHVGRLGWPLVNGVDLDDYCDGRNASGSSYDREIGVIMHEVMHSLGVHHTQARCDRDSFISVQTQNILSHGLSNFDKKCSDATDYGPYDFSSVMHYPPDAFTNDNGPTIIAHDPNNTWLMGNRQALSFGDRNVLRGMYGYQCIPSRNSCHSWECGYVDVGCGVKLACGPCQPCEGSYCSDGSCCPSTGMCSDGLACPL